MKEMADFVGKHYRIIVSVGFLILLGGIFSAGRIGIVTDARAMLPRDNSFVRSYNAINENFSSATLLITVEGEDRYRMIRAARSLAEKIQRDSDLIPYLKAVNLQPDRDFLYRWYLMRQDPDDSARTLKLFDNLSLSGFFRQYNDNLEDNYAEEDAQDDIDSSREEREAAQYLGAVEQVVSIIRSGLEDPAASPPRKGASEAADLLLAGELWNFNRTGRMLLFSVSPDFQVDDIEATMFVMERISLLLADEKENWEDLEFGYAGDVAQNYDEQIALGSDTILPALLALLIILLLFLFSFKSIRLVFMALISLTIGIAATILTVFFSIGTINMLTSLFSILLVGLGIDFGIHIITGLDRCRASGMGRREALSSTYRSSGRAVILGAVTTALAFFSLTLTGSQAIRQFGVVSGTGILLTLLSEMLVLPALFMLFPGKKIVRRLWPVCGYDGLKSLGNLMADGRRVVISIALLALLIPLPHIRFLSFEYNMGDIGPQQSVSVRTQKKIEESFGLSPFPVMISVKKMDELRKITEQIKGIRQVALINSASDLIREEDVQIRNLTLIQEKREAYTKSVPSGLTFEDLENFQYEIQRLEWNMIELGDLAVAALGEGNMVQLQRDEMIREILGAERGRPGREVFQGVLQLIDESPDVSREYLGRFQEAFSYELDQRFRMMLSPDRLMNPGDIPGEIRSGLISHTGDQYLLSVNPDRTVTGKEGLVRFRRSLDEVHDGFTGTIPLFVEFTESVASEVGIATLLIILIFFLVMFFSFRSLKLTLIAFLSLTEAVLIMFGLLPLLGIRFNATNVMILPLIFGLGIDFQIHIIHRYQMDLSLPRALFYAGKGVLLSALTTMIGFGSLGLIGAMEAARELGLMLFTGIGLCLVSSLTLLPALLSIFCSGEEHISLHDNNILED